MKPLLKTWFISFFSYRKGRQIALFVSLFHLFFVMFLCLDHWISFRASPQKKSLAVRTFQKTIPQKKSPISSVCSAPPPQKSRISKASRPVPKKEKKINFSEKKSAPAPSRVTEKKRAHQQWNIPSPLEIETPSTTSIALTSNPQETTIDAYGKTLITFLQQTLQLPEQGTVKIKLVLQGSGQLSHLEILDAQNEKNSAWLKNELIQLDYPCFNQFGIENSFLEFKIIFRNVDSNF